LMQVLDRAAGRAQRLDDGGLIGVDLRDSQSKPF
jgi:hypothetical protein